MLIHRIKAEVNQGIFNLSVSTIYKAQCYILWSRQKKYNASQWLNLAKELEQQTNSCEKADAFHVCLPVIQTQHFLQLLHDKSKRKQTDGDCEAIASSVELHSLKLA